MDGLPTIFEQCAPAIDPRLMVSLVKRESNFNPFAIGLDGKAVLKEQPRSLEEALKKVDELVAANQTFSVGLAQIHIGNVKRFGLTWTQAFNACTNLRYGQIVLQSFYNQAIKAGYKDAEAVFVTLRGYNSGKIEGTVSNGYANAIMDGVMRARGLVGGYQQAAMNASQQPQQIAYQTRSGEFIDVGAQLPQSLEHQGDVQDFLSGQAPTTPTNLAASSAVRDFLDN